MKNVIQNLAIKQLAKLNLDNDAKDLGWFTPSLLESAHDGMILELLNIFVANAGKSRQALHDAVMEQVCQYPNFLQIPSQLLRSYLESRFFRDQGRTNNTSPSLRQALFIEAQAQRQRQHPMNRHSTIEAVANKMGLMAEQIEQLLFADLNPEAIAVLPTCALDPASVRRDANRFYICALLRRSLMVAIFSNQRLHGLLATAKSMGLIAELIETDDDPESFPRLELSGPLIIHKGAKIYGERLASVFTQLPQDQRVHFMSLIRHEGTTKILVLESWP